jgi:hypothetical protein
MTSTNLKLLIVCALVGCLVPAGLAFTRPHFNIDCYEQWEEALGPRVRPMLPHEWEDYMAAWRDPDSIIEGEPYPDTEFFGEGLYVYEGGGEWTDPDSGETYYYPEDAGLVMYWGTPEPVDANVAGAFVYDWPEDPDISNSLLQTQVWVPKTRPFGLGGAITQVSFGIKDSQFQHRYWYWNCGPGKTFPYETWITVTINPSMAGVNATTPKADGFSGSWFFDPKKAVSIYLDENGRQVGGSFNIPDPKNQMTQWHLWNYWNYLMVIPNPNPGNPPSTQPKPSDDYKYHIKWNQPPEIIDANAPKLVLGWDELSDYRRRPVVADDWLCKDPRPVTDIHWWGSFIGWGQPYPPPILPRAFHIGIWTNTPNPDPCDPTTFSHPDHLIWENFCDNWVWNFFGYDKHPWEEPYDYKETCFQFNQLLSEDEWFYQEPDEPNTIYWLSIAAIYDPNDYNDPNFYPWGWKTRPHFFEDDAVQIHDVVTAGGIGPVWPPTVCNYWHQGIPIKWPPYPDPQGVTWDMSFQLTTTVPEAKPEPNDTTPPLPDPPVWDISPQPAAPTVITMTAKTATDESGVEYFFDEITGNPGADDSGWQDSSGYTDSGLDPSTIYAYAVRVRDKSPNQNKTAWSTIVLTATPPVSPDLYPDGFINFKDIAVIANAWLTSP